MRLSFVKYFYWHNEHILQQLIQVSKVHSELAETEDSTEGGNNGDEEEDSLEFLNIPDDVHYLEPLLRLLALLHSFTAFAIMTAYYCLKVGHDEYIHFSSILCHLVCVVLFHSRHESKNLISCFLRILCYF